MPFLLIPILLLEREGRAEGAKGTEGDPDGALLGTTDALGCDDGRKLGAKETEGFPEGDKLGKTVPVGARDGKTLGK